MSSPRDGKKGMEAYSCIAFMVIILAFKVIIISSYKHLINRDSVMCATNCCMAVTFRVTSAHVSLRTLIVISYSLFYYYYF